MKKILFGSIVLSMFSISIILFQISCQKEVIAQTNNPYVLPPATTAALGGVIVGQGLSVSNTGVLSTNSASGVTQQGFLLIGHNNNFTLMNYDGTNMKTIPIVLPSGRILNGTNGILSPDGKTLFFEVYESSSNTHFIYSCLIDGTALKIITSSTSDSFSFLGAY